MGQDDRENTPGGGKKREGGLRNMQTRPQPFSCFFSPLPNQILTATRKIQLWWRETVRRIYPRRLRMSRASFALPTGLVSPSSATSIRLQLDLDAAVEEHDMEDSQSLSASTARRHSSSTRSCFSTQPEQSTPCWGGRVLGLRVRGEGEGACWG